MSWGIMFAKRDDPASQKAFGCYTQVYGILAGLFLVTVVSVFFVQQLNLLLGVEKKCTVTIQSSQVVDTRRHTRELVLKIESGGEFRQKINSVSYGILATGDGESVEVKIDGLFWKRIVAVKKKDGYRTVY